MQPSSSPTHPVAYSIKRHGTTINDCDSEPVQTPGCIQPHGALLVLRASDLAIVQASENSAAWLGFAPDALLNSSVTKVWTDHLTASFRQFLSREILERNPVYFATIAPKGNPTASLDVIVHRIGDIVIVEFEAANAPVPEAKSFDPDYYSLVKKTLTRFQNAPTLKNFCQVFSEEIQRITGLDRVMIYKFHADGSGEVFAETRRPDLQSWLGFRYPAHDIPKPAREIFKRIWIRPVPDIKAQLAEMVPLVHPETGRPLEMTHCALRGASVMYTEYLENMGVGAALTMSIKRDGELWGLVACHHYSPHSFSYQLRAACEFVAQAASLQLKSAEDREHAEYRARLDSVHYKLLTHAAAKNDLSSFTQGMPNLLAGMEASGAAVLHGRVWHTCGKTPARADLDRLSDWLRVSIFSAGTSPEVFATDHLAARLPEAAAFADVASGLLAIPISATGRSFILWFRPETIQTFTWAGNPNDLPLTAGPNGPRLTPRKSFELWRETVRQRALPWNPVEIDAAAKFRLLVMELVVGHVDQLNELNAELSRSNEDLGAFAYAASHDLKEPLRGIDKSASQVKAALESPGLDLETNRQRLEGIERLVGRMSDLINSLLHFSRLGSSKTDLETNDLNHILREATEMLGVLLAERKAQLMVPRPLPIMPSQRIRVREILYNLISNAVKYNDKELKIVEVGFVEAGESPAPPRLPETARGQRVFYVRDNGIGIDTRHHEEVFRIFKRLHPRDAFGGGSGAGLAIVRRLVEQHHGTIWLDSRIGQGTTFFFTLDGVDSSS